MNIQIGEDLRMRIEYFAKIFKQSPAEYVGMLIDRAVPSIPNQAEAVQHLQNILDGKYASVDEGNIDEYVRSLNDARLQLPTGVLSEIGSSKS